MAAKKSAKVTTTAPAVVAPLEDLRVIALEVSNFMKLKTVQLEPDPYVNEVSGDNGAGKSCLFESIKWAVEGNSALAEVAIREGAESMRVFANLGPILITRIQNELGTSTSITAPDGTPYQSPQRLLDELKSALSFDPQALEDMPPAKQRQVLADLVGLSQRFDVLTLEEKNLFDQRRDTARDGKAAKSQLDGMPVIDPALERIDTAEVLRQMTEADQRNAHWARDVGKAEAYNRDWERLEVEITARRVQQAELAAGIDKIGAHWEGFERIETAPLRQQLVEAEAVNAAVEQRARRDQQEAEVARLRERFARQETEIEAKRAEKRALVESVTFPVDGLGLAEDCITFNGLPIAQASEGQRQEIFFAIACDMNPKIKIVLVKDAALMMPARRERVRALARAKKMQVWLEVADVSGDIGIFLEDGAVARINPPAVAL